MSHKSIDTIPNIEDVRKIQADVYTQRTDLNPDLSNDPRIHVREKINVPLRANGAPDIRYDNPVKMINVLSIEMKDLDSSVNQRLEEFSDALGPFIDNPQLISDMQKIAPTTLESLVKIYSSIVGDINSPLEFPAETSVNEQVVITKTKTEAIEKKIYPLESIVLSANQDSFLVDTEETNLYIVDENNIRWNMPDDFTIAPDTTDPSKNRITLTMTLPYNLKLNIFKG